MTVLYTVLGASLLQARPDARPGKLRASSAIPSRPNCARNNASSPDSSWPTHPSTSTFLLFSTQTHPFSSAVELGILAYHAGGPAAPRIICIMILRHSAPSVASVAYPFNLNLPGRMLLPTTSFTKPSASTVMQYLSHDSYNRKESSEKPDSWDKNLFSILFFAITEEGLGR